MKIQQLDLNTGKWNTVLTENWIRVVTEDGSEYDIDKNIHSEDSLCISAVHGQIFIEPRAANVIWVSQKDKPKRVVK